MVNNCSEKFCVLCLCIERDDAYAALKLRCNFFQLRILRIYGNYIVVETAVSK